MGRTLKISNTTCWRLLFLPWSWVFESPFCRWKEKLFFNWHLQNVQFEYFPRSSTYASPPALFGSRTLLLKPLNSNFDYGVSNIVKSRHVFLRRRAVTNFHDVIGKRGYLSHPTYTRTPLFHGTPFFLTCSVWCILEGAHRCGPAARRSESARRCADQSRQLAFALRVLLRPLSGGSTADHERSRHRPPEWQVHVDYSSRFDRCDCVLPW